MSARLAYAPTLALSPQGTVSSWDKGKATQTYSLPVTASWQIDLFGQILNPKRGAQVSLKQTQFYEQAVQTQVIANVANMYYTLLMLDRQLQITESTADILKKNVETVEAMKDAGIYNTTSAGVEQTRAAYAQVLASLPSMRQSIRETENALCLMLNQPAQEIERGVLEGQQLPTEFSAGIPLQLLSNRPDVKAAEMSLADKLRNNILHSSYNLHLIIRVTNLYQLLNALLHLIIIIFANCSNHNLLMISRLCQFFHIQQLFIQFFTMTQSSELNLHIRTSGNVWLRVCDCQG